MTYYKTPNISFNIYDKQQTAVGIDIINEYIKKENFKHIVSIGCGSGIYLKTLAKNYKLLENITLLGIDESQGALDTIPESINTKQLNFTPSTSLDIGTVDIIILNQFIHTLNEETLLNLMNECFNSLSENGIIYVNTSSDEQILNSYWWSSYFPPNLIKIYATDVDKLNKILLGKYIPIETRLIKTPLQHNYYLYHRVFYQYFRNGSDMWNILNTMQLDNILESIKFDLKRNKLNKINTSYDYKEEFGQTTAYIFKKS
jgi:ubiquinone/menaquinone biosynthesis C-methylase UbiE